MAKKFLRKNEARLDLNPKHVNIYGYPHKAVISAKQGHKFKANTQTHAEYVNGIKTLDLEPHLPKNVKHKRISPPFWQNENQFGEKIPNSRVNKNTFRKIQKYNKNNSNKQ